MFCTCALLQCRFPVASSTGCVSRSHCSCLSLPHPAAEPENPDLWASKETPLHLAVMSGGLLINYGTVFPGTQSRERSALAAAGPGCLVFREDTGQRGALSRWVLPTLWAEAGYSCLETRLFSAPTSCYNGLRQTALCLSCCAQGTRLSVPSSLAVCFQAFKSR